MRGGRRPGAGRKKGSAMTKTAALLDKYTAEGETPLGFVLAVMRDETQSLSVRLSCAQAALPFVHPRLAHVQVERKPNPDVLRKLLDHIHLEEQSLQAATVTTAAAQPVLIEHRS